MHTSETWGQQIDPEIYQTIEQHERDRQEAMNEIVYTEEQYQRDLEILHEVSIGIVSRLLFSMADMLAGHRDSFNRGQRPR